MVFGEVFVEIMMCVCPKCGDIGMGFTKDMCDVCKVKVIETDMSWDKYCYELTAVEKKQWEQEITEKYVKSSPLFDSQAQNERLAQKAKEQYKEQHQVKCPTCQSANVQRISGLERGVSVAMLGLFSKKINKSFKCNHCGYTW